MTGMNALQHSWSQSWDRGQLASDMGVSPGSQVTMGGAAFELLRDPAVSGLMSPAASLHHESPLALQAD